ncbi:DUF5313 domain-containing protein [Aldersonia sp. NBC_00410]|uniref:DUF5313 family protein n=1 Tax=Aldersonia sp. NBC_00410 TaxID=2975954 RepID=UPI00224D62A2|nr:DUF5313 family protein [Aldersonia sp. NBC_00410]MCX5046432.1 DUF5313 domain-containing protein [Aldersonia sp. NBC_00410]
MPQTQPSTKPTTRQRLGYLAGRTLPSTLHEWVVNDITGPGATRRYAIRWLVPLVPILTALLFLPGPWIIRIGMVLLLFVPFLYFLTALKDVYLRHRLLSHGLDPQLLGTHKQRRRDKDRAEYETRYRSAR